MAIFFINGNNATGTYPYSSPSNGAPNFSTLFDNIGNIVNDYDEIVITGNADVDDSSADINIIHRLKITGEENSPVILKNDGVGFNVLIDGVVFRNVNFKKNEFTDNTMITCLSNGLEVDNCNFDYVSSFKGSVINLTDCSGFNITNNYINVPSGSPFAYGVYITGGGYGLIRNNVIDMNENNGQAITLNDCCETTIKQNIIGDFAEGTTNNIGISVNGICNFNKLIYNVIGVAGANSFGIVLNPGNIGFKETDVYNNLIAIRENDFGSGGLFISYSPNNTESYFNIINNIISFRPNVSPEATFNDSVAINASIQRGVIDFNDIFGFDAKSEFVNNSAPDVITELGDRNIFVDPRTNWTEDPDKYPREDPRRYFCTPKSECIGSGYQHHNIGVGVDGLFAREDNYVNIVDTVTCGASDLQGYSTSYVTFFNDLIMEDPDAYNIIFREGNGPYPSEDVYKNQWDYSLEQSFPFEVGDGFYGKDFYYVLANKRDLAPFKDIKCPANPGYGFSAYPGYETGLWGFPRVDYRNNCFPDPCVIQDSYTETIILKDVIPEVTFTIIDAINPNCLEEDVNSDEVVLATVTFSDGITANIIDNDGSRVLTNNNVANMLNTVDNHPSDVVGIELFNTIKGIDERALGGFCGGYSGVCIGYNMDMPELVIPASVEYIGWGAFYWWGSMTGKLRFDSTTPPVIGVGNIDIGMGVFDFWFGECEGCSSPHIPVIDIIVPSSANLLDWKNALDQNGPMRSINNVLWENIS